jgi:hypothetical protein
MAIESLRLTTLQVVNEVQDKLGVNRTSTLFATKHARVLTGLLNEVMDELSDYAEWQELYFETTVAAQTSVASYTIDPSDDSLVNKIEEIAWASAISSMYPVSKEDIRRLRRIGSFGEPRQFSIIGTDEFTGAPKFEVYPTPGSNQSSGQFLIAFYKKPNILAVSADSSTVLPFPGQLLINGLYAKALLEENGGEPTDQYNMALAIYERQKLEASNRWNADTGTDIYFIPSRR